MELTCINCNKKFEAKRKDTLRITPEFRQLVVEALMFLPQDFRKRKLTRMHRLDQLDEWRVELTYETIKMPGEAFKATDYAGGLQSTREFPSIYWVTATRSARLARKGQENDN